MLPASSNFCAQRTPWTGSFNAPQTNQFTQRTPGAKGHFDSATMSFTASAATALFTVLANDPEDDDPGRRWGDQTKESRDLYTQFVISFVLGLGAFVSFCVGVGIILDYRWSLSNRNFSRCCDRNGQIYMLLGGDNVAPRRCQSFPTASLDGYRCSIGSRKRKSCTPRAWTHTW